MLKMSVAVHRRADLSRAAFLDYWQTVHAALVREHAAVLRVRRYVQLHGADLEVTRLFTESRGCRPPHDGVVEIWWDSEVDRIAGIATPEGREASRLLREDELRFCDMAASSVVFGHEHVVIG
jgi:uncharacterized protein (TIGR02118 family)